MLCRNDVDLASEEVVAFHITKDLGPGTIRFKVASRRTTEDLSNEPLTLSTGPAGEYAGKRGGLYYAESRKSSDPILEAAREHNITGSLFEALTGKHLIMIGVGGLLLLIGIMAVINKGAPGVIWVIIGLAVMIAPVAAIMKRRRDIRMQIERDQANRTAEEQRRRDTIANFLAKLERFENEMTEDNAEELRREHSALAVPYELVEDTVRETVVRIGFRLLPHLVKEGPEYVADALDFATEATELAPSKIIEAKRQVFETVLWHLLADDRFSLAHEELLEDFRRKLRLDPDVIAIDIMAMRDFHALRGVTPKRLPNVEAPVQLGFQEICYHHTRGSLLAAPRKSIANALRPGESGGNGNEGTECAVFVTSKRLMITTDVSREVLLPKIYSVELAADRNALIVTDAEQKDAYELSVNDPVYTGAILEMAIAAAV